MAVRITEIHVQRCGPLRQLSLNLGRFNLIYGRNEQGKTHLVEFLIRSLFRKDRSWMLRSSEGKGKVRVEGLEDKPVSFSPGSGRKLEDFWDAQGDGLPPDFSKLLVIKGAELDFIKGKHRDMFRRYLSGQELVETIRGQISSTIGSVQIGDGVISGDRRNRKILEREKLESELKDIDLLFSQIDADYSGGQRSKLAQQQEDLDAALQRQRDAKRHAAWRLSEEIGRHERQRGAISRKTLEQARETLLRYRDKQNEAQRRRAKLNEAASKNQHHAWLSAATETYRRLLDERAAPPSRLFLILAGVSVISAGVLTVLQMTPWALVAIVLASTLTLLYLRQARAQAVRAPVNHELKQIEAEFVRRFGETFTGLPQIEEQLRKMDLHAARLSDLQDEVAQIEKDVEAFGSRLRMQLKELSGDEVDPERAEEILAAKAETLRKLQAEIQEKERNLIRLDVDPSDYLADKPEESYSRQESARLQESLDMIREELRGAHDNLALLKIRIRDKTGDDPDVDWPVLIEHLLEKRQETADQFRRLTAEILGKVALNSVLDDLQTQEDRKIAEGLQSNAIRDTLKQITNRYRSLELADQQLNVSDDFNDFPFTDLSTGAQEQVLLALRIGFARKLLQHDTLFLILDDAFQYSDWKRRVGMVEMAAELASNGWQILYLTMDDHLRELFSARGDRFGEDYRHWELNDGSAVAQDNPYAR